jgi:hypothetical protein
MEINANNPVDNRVQGLETTPKVETVKQEKEETPGRQTTHVEANPDYHVNLSAASKQAAGEATTPLAPIDEAAIGAISENDAERLAQQTAAQLAQTNVSIANQGMQKALDLFS